MTLTSDVTHCKKENEIENAITGNFLIHADVLLFLPKKKTRRALKVKGKIDLAKPKVFCASLDPFPNLEFKPWPPYTLYMLVIRGHVEFVIEVNTSHRPPNILSSHHHKL